MLPEMDWSCKKMKPKDLQQYREAIENERKLNATDWKMTEHAGVIRKLGVEKI